MPYLEEYDKFRIGRGGLLMSAGDLTYALTKALLDSDPNNAYTSAWQAVSATVDRFIESLAEVGAKVRYADYATILGCLDSTWREYSRRMPWSEGTKANRIWAVRDFAEHFYDNVVAPYEDTKIEENGDVYPS